MYGDLEGNYINKVVKALGIKQSKSKDNIISKTYKDNKKCSRVRLDISCNRLDSSIALDPCKFDF